MYDYEDPLTQIKENYPRSKFESLNLPLYTIPKSHTPLPTKDGKIKKNFCNPRDILKHWTDKAYLFSTFDKRKIEFSKPLIIFTYVMPDGLGDWSTQIEVADLIHKVYPKLPIHLVTLLDHLEKRKLHTSHPNTIIRFSKDKKPLIPKQTLQVMNSGALILEIPTSYKYFQKLYSKLPNKPEHLLIGEYGFIDTENFHPASKAYCMGLHTLEKGLLLKDQKKSISRDKNSYFAYLTTKRGAAIYLHAILHHRKNDSHNLTIQTCHLLPLLTPLKEPKNFLNYKIKEIFIKDLEHGCRIPISKSGKTITIKSYKNIKRERIYELMEESANFVGCRGDRSFTEAISSNSFFFYDAPKHARPFVNHLYHLAKFHLLGFPYLLDYLLLLNDEKTKAIYLGQKIGDLLCEPSLYCGMEKLIKIILNEHRFNETLIHMVTQKIEHHHSPEIAKKEELHLQQFLKGNLDLKDYLFNTI